MVVSVLLFNVIYIYHVGIIMGAVECTKLTREIALIVCLALFHL